jgi:lysophospholipase L1-like esterase
MALSYEDIVQGAYSSIGRTGMGNAVGQIDPEGYNFWLDALKAGVVSPDQLYANFNQAVAATIQQQPQAANSQAVAAYIEANPLATQIDPKKVVAVGDSTTWGYNQGNQVAENMVTTAQKALGSDYSVSNLGINSTTAGDFLNSSDFDKALSSGAGTVVLNYGMNEAYRNEDPATFAKNLLTAVQTLQAVGKKVILQTPNSTSSTDAWAQNVGAYADVVRSVSQQTGSTLDDKFTYTSGLTNATSATDPIHPTAATYGLLGTNLADAIKTTTTGVAPKAISVTPPVAAAQAPSLVANQGTTATTTAAANSTVKLFADTFGRAPTQEEIDRFGDTIEAGEQSSFLGSARQEVVNTLPTTGAAANIASQILAQGTTDKWGGEGFGSATKNAYDMGVMLAGQGLRDINDFGQRTNANGEQEFFNKATGEAIKPFYDKASGNIWGGTFVGKDSTAYGVEFDAAGKPLFYSQYGGDSSDVPSWVVPALAIGGILYGLDTSGLLSGTATTTGTAGLSALDAGLGVYGTGAAGTAGGIAGGLSALDAGMGVYGTGGTAGGLAGGLSALDAGMGVYPSTGNIGLSALDAGLGVYPNTGNIGLSALDAGMGVYPNTGNIIPSALDAGMGVYPNTGSIIPSALDAGMGVYPNTGNIGLSALDAGMGVYGTGGTVLPSTGVGTGLENILSNLTPGQIANIVGGVGGLLGGAGVVKAVTGGGGGGAGGVGALPTQGVPLNTADYYRAIQQNYNRLLPAVPRDVATPLAQWYNSTYGA